MQVPHPTSNPPHFFLVQNLEKYPTCLGVILNMCFQFNPTKIPILFSFLNQLPFYSSSWGQGGFLPSDESRVRVLAGLTYLARCCQKLQHLTLLGGSSSAASSLLLQVQKGGPAAVGCPHISWK